MTPQPIALRVQSGLANRLRTLASFYYLAKFLGRPFLLYWGESTGFSDEKYDQLFENKENHIDLISESDFEKIALSAIRLDELIVKDQKKSGIVQRDKAFSMPLLYEESMPITYIGNLHLPALLSKKDMAALPSFTKDVPEFLRKLRPQIAYQKEIDRVASAFTRSTVGVHIRRGDALKSAGSEKYKLSSDQAFIQTLQKEIELDPAATFFLATDCRKTEQIFRELFGKRIIINEKKKFVPSRLNAAKGNQGDALIDLWLLSRTAKVLGNNFSSFSKMGALLGEIELTIVYE